MAIWGRAKKIDTNPAYFKYTLKQQEYGQREHLSPVKNSDQAPQ
jgi:hypothetical protein